MSEIEKRNARAAHYIKKVNRKRERRESEKYCNKCLAWFIIALVGTILLWFYNVELFLKAL